jgi:dolichol-phosphate mannosyltransferase
VSAAQSLPGVLAPPALGETFHFLPRFALVGLSGVIVNCACLALLHAGVGLPLLVAVPTAVEVSIVNNYVWNNSWTFSSRRGSGRSLLRFNLACLAGLIAATLVVQTLVIALGVHYLAANTAGILAASASNFALSTTWAWPKRKS